MEKSEEPGNGMFYRKDVHAEGNEVMEKPEEQAVTNTVFDGKTETNALKTSAGSIVVNGLSESKQDVSNEVYDIKLRHAATLKSTFCQRYIF